MVIVRWRWIGATLGCGGLFAVGEIFPGVDVKAEPVQRDRLDQAALDAGVDVEGGRLEERTVLAVEHRVDLARASRPGR